MKLNNIKEGITSRTKQPKPMLSETMWILFSPSSGRYLGATRSHGSPRYAWDSGPEQMAKAQADKINERAKREEEGASTGQPRDERLYAPWEAREMITSYYIK